MRAALLLLALAGCDAGHLGNPLRWPFDAAATALENAAYGARRDRVSALLATEGVAIRAGDAAALARLWTVSRAPEASRPAILRDLHALAPGPGWVEQATLAVMVRSG